MQAGQKAAAIRRSQKPILEFICVYIQDKIGSGAPLVEQREFSRLPFRLHSDRSFDRAGCLDR